MTFFGALLPSVNNHTLAVDDVARFIIGADIVLFVIIVSAMFLFVFMYNKKRHPRAVNVHGSVALETIWTVLPIALVMVMFYLGWAAYIQTRFVPKSAMEVKVIARQWEWSFVYNNGKKWNTLFLPQGRTGKMPSDLGGCYPWFLCASFSREARRDTGQSQIHHALSRRTRELRDYLQPVLRSEPCIDDDEIDSSAAGQIRSVVERRNFKRGSKRCLDRESIGQDGRKIGR